MLDALTDIDTYCFTVYERMTKSFVAKSSRENGIFFSPFDAKKSVRNPSLFSFIQFRAIIPEQRRSTRVTNVGLSHFTRINRFARESAVGGQV